MAAGVVNRVVSSSSVGSRPGVSLYTVRARTTMSGLDRTAVKFTAATLFGWSRTYARTGSHTVV